MPADAAEAPEITAERVALWRAMHLQVDPPPHVLADEIGLQLLAPHDGWRSRPDMDPQATSTFRAAIVARARFIEDLVAGQVDQGVAQYVILGAGLDTFAQRRPELIARLQVFEVDQPGPQAWKRRRLLELGYGIPDGLHLVPVDFEASENWWDQLRAAGFDPPSARGRRLHRRFALPHRGRDYGDVASDRGAGARIDIRDDLPPALRAPRRCGPSRAADQRRRRQELRNAVHQLLHPRRNDGTRSRSRAHRNPPRRGRFTCRPLFLRPDRRPAPVQR